MSEKQEKADRLNRWWEDDARLEVITEIQDAQKAVFMDPRSTLETREAAHRIVCAITEMEAVVAKAVRRGRADSERQERVNV